MNNIFCTLQRIPLSQIHPSLSHSPQPVLLCLPLSLPPPVVHRGGWEEAKQALGATVFPVSSGAGCLCQPSAHRFLNTVCRKPCLVGRVACTDPTTAAPRPPGHAPSSDWHSGPLRAHHWLLTGTLHSAGDALSSSSLEYVSFCSTTITAP